MNFFISFLIGFFIGSVAGCMLLCYPIRGSLPDPASPRAHSDRVGIAFGRRPNLKAGPLAGLDPQLLNMWEKAIIKSGLKEAWEPLNFHERRESLLQQDGKFKNLWDEVQREFFKVPVVPKMEPIKLETLSDVKTLDF